MYDAGLHQRLLDRGNRFREALQSVDRSDQDVVNAACLEFADDSQPELGASGLLDPGPEHVLCAVVRCFRPARHNRLVLDQSSSRILTRIRSGRSRGAAGLCHSRTSSSTASLLNHETHAEPRSHLLYFVNACSFAKRLKTLKGLILYEFKCRTWTNVPNRFTLKSALDAKTKL